MVGTYSENGRRKITREDHKHNNWGREEKRKTEGDDMERTNCVSKIGVYDDKQKVMEKKRSLLGWRN